MSALTNPKVHLALDHVRSSLKASLHTEAARLLDSAHADLAANGVNVTRSDLFKAYTIKYPELI